MAGRARSKSPAAVVGVSPLRQARLSIPATLEQVSEDLDKRSKDDSSGVTPSMLSGWELGKYITSIKYRKMLADYYSQPPEVLFAHQDQQLTAASETPRLLVGHHDLRAAMTEVVRDAGQYLAVVGSRSRDAAYLDAIEAVLVQRPELVHYRVLFGPPRHQVLKDHLLRLVNIRDPHDRSLGLKTLHIGIVEDDPGTPERFFCASESTAVVPIPSLTSAEAFDSGVLHLCPADDGPYSPPTRRPAHRRRPHHHSYAGQDRCASGSRRCGHCGVMWPPRTTHAPNRSSLLPILVEPAAWRTRRHTSNRLRTATSDSQQGD